MAAARFLLHRLKRAYRAFVLVSAGAVVCISGLYFMFRTGFRQEVGELPGTSKHSG